MATRAPWPAASAARLEWAVALWFERTFAIRPERPIPAWFERSVSTRFERTVARGPKRPVTVWLERSITTRFERSVPTRFERAVAARAVTWRSIAAPLPRGLKGDRPQAGMAVTVV
jgi:hypothetical protein